MKNHILLAILAGLLLMAGLTLLGCKGPTGPQGPAGPAGPPANDQNTYLGDDQTSCGHCHSAVVAEWQTAAHSHAFADLDTNTTNLYCVQCHTTGFDDGYDFSGHRTTQGVSNRGYDDEPRAATQNVQCEACHGPMGPALTHEPIMDQALSGEQCSRCHVAYGDYITSGHGTVIARNEGGRQGVYDEWKGNSCKGCHISEGFLGLPFTEATFHQIACATCHDPHAGNSSSQLRLEKLVTDTLLYKGPSLTGADTNLVMINDWGKGQLCARCHHSRAAIGGNSGVRAQVTNGTSRPGPHHSPQADMLAGVGCYAPGPADSIEHVGPHTTSNLPDMCIECHFTDRDHGDPIHTFEPHLEQCQNCHAGAINFDIDGVQSEVQQLLDQLRGMLPAIIDSTTNNTPGWTPTLREAAYAWYFVTNDGSKGVHNANYARSLLRASIRHLQAAATGGDAFLHN
jgi:hypothetical protein